MTYSVDKFKSKVSQNRGLARSNLFVVTLPSFSSNGEALNVLCKGTSIPGRNITTAERSIGVLPRQIATGFVRNNISFTFHLTNTYEIKNYFDLWHRNIVGNTFHNTINYYDKYVRRIGIKQLRKGESFATFSVESPIDLNLPSLIRDRLPNLGIPNIGGTGIGIGGVDLGDVLSGGNINLAVFTSENVVFECELEEAYPISISDITFSNTTNEVLELTVEMTYYKWVSSEDQFTGLQGPTDNTNIGDTVNDALNNAIGAAINATGLSGFIT